MILIQNLPKKLKICPLNRHHAVVVMYIPKNGFFFALNNEGMQQCYVQSVPDFGPMQGARPQSVPDFNPIQSVPNFGPMQLVPDFRPM